MEAYDPHRAPDPERWLAMDEDERYLLVRDHHREAGVELPNERLHAMFHVVVENQLAMDDPPEARRAFERVREEGLDRHEAIHAVASVLAGALWEAGQEDSTIEDPNEDYVRELEGLTAESWREGAE